MLEPKVLETKYVQPLWPRKTGVLRALTLIKAYAHVHEYAHAIQKVQAQICRKGVALVPGTRVGFIYTASRKGQIELHRYAFVILAGSFPHIQLFWCTKAVLANLAHAQKTQARTGL